MSFKESDLWVKESKQQRSVIVLWLPSINPFQRCLLVKQSCILRRVSVASAGRMRVATPFFTLCFTCFSPFEPERHLVTPFKARLKGRWWEIIFFFCVCRQSRALLSSAWGWPQCETQNAQLFPVNVCCAGKWGLPKHVVLLVSAIRAQNWRLQAKLSAPQSLKVCKTAFPSR